MLSLADWDYVLQTARALEQAIGHGLVSPLERLRKEQRGMGRIDDDI